MSNAMFLGLVVAVIAFTDSHSIASPKAWNLYDLAQNKITKFDSLSQFYNLESLSPPEAKKDTKIVRMQISLWPMKSLIESDRKHTICGPTTAKELVKIDKYHLSSRSTAKFVMPEVVERLTKSVAYQISANCKINMVDYLSNLGDKLGRNIYNNPLVNIQTLESKNAVIFHDEDMSFQHTDGLRVASAVSKMLRRGLAELGPDFDPYNDLSVRLETWKFFTSVKHSCENQFRPIYYWLTRTLQELTDLGYDYSVSGKLLRDHKTKFENNKSLTRWFNIMTVCEAIGGLDVYKGDDMPKLKMVTQASFPSRQLEDDILVDVQSDNDELTSMEMMSERETTEVVEKIYVKIVGDTKRRSDREFWVAFMEFIDVSLHGSD